MGLWGGLWVLGLGLGFRVLGLGLCGVFKATSGSGEALIASWLPGCTGWDGLTYYACYS